MAEKKTPPVTASGAPSVDAAALCRVLGIDERHVRAMGERGVMVRIGRNRYDFAASIKGYCTHLRELAAGHKSENGPSNVAENALFTRERRRKLMMEADVAAGKLIPVELVETVMADHIKGLRGMILGIVNELQAEMPSLTAFDLDTVRKVCEKVLRDNALKVIEQTGQHPVVNEYVAERQGVQPI